MFHPLVRARVRRELRDRGVPFAKSFALAASLTDTDIDDAATTSADMTAAVGALGDGSILKAIIDFLNSELGQSLIKLLASLLLGL